MVPSCLAVDTHCELKAHLGLFTETLLHSFSMWLRLFTACQMGSKRGHPKSECSKKAEVEATRPVKGFSHKWQSITFALFYWSRQSEG